VDAIGTPNTNILLKHNVMLPKIKEGRGMTARRGRKL